MSLSPIILFTYNRPFHTQRTIQSLLENPEAAFSDLIVFSDAPKKLEDRENVESVRNYIRSLKGFHSIELIERQKNLGLAGSIISGVSKILSTHNKVIVLEDDLITSKHFLNYMNAGLETYANDENVASIHGYIYPHKSHLPETFFIKGADCWGWATWKRAWNHFDADGNKLLTTLKSRGLTKEFDLDGAYDYTKMLEDWVNKKNDSWAVRWYASAFLKDMLTLYPKKSLVKNIGFDGSGVHCDTQNAYDDELSEEMISVTKITPCENREARKVISQSLLKPRKITSRTIRFLKRKIDKIDFSKIRSPR